MWDRRARLDRVIDGDTIAVECDQGFGQELHLELRLFGVYAPERSQPGGPETKAFVQAWFDAQPDVAWPFVVTTIRMKQTDREQMTFTRYVAIVDSLDGSSNLNAAVTQFVADHGYGGGTGSPNPT